MNVLLLHDCGIICILLRLFKRLGVAAAAPPAVGAHLGAGEPSGKAATSTFTALLAATGYDLEQEVGSCLEFSR